MYIYKAAVIGAGTMGAQIAQVISYSGLPVILKDLKAEAVEAGMETIRKIYQARVDKGKMTASDLDQKMALVTGTTSYEGFKDVDIVIEAVFEDLEIKKKVFKDLDEACQHCARGNYAGAIEAYSAAVRVDRGFALGWKNRAHVYFFEGRFEDAAADYAAYVELCPHDASAVMLGYLASVRSGIDSVDSRTELARHARALDLNGWPGAAIAMFLGEAEPEAMLAQASGDSESVKNDGRHLGFFYVGQYYLLQANTVGAVEMFRVALLDGARDCFEYELAGAELDRLSVRVLVPRARR